MKKVKTARIGKEPLPKRLFKNNSYCWVAFLCSAGIMMLVYLCYSFYPIGDTTVFRMDLYHQYGPLFAELYERLVGLRSFIYSWNTGLGSSFLGNFFNYLSSPLSFLVVLFGHKNVPEAIATIILLKSAFSAASFTYYIKASQKKHDYTSAAFGVLYSFCGFFIAYFWNIMWLDAMVIFPLVILGIEKIINDEKPLTYILSLAFALVTSFYMGYMTCIFSVVYFLVYYFSHNSLGSSRPQIPYSLNMQGKKKYRLTDKIKYSSLLRSGIVFAVSSAMAAALVAAALLPVFNILLASSATSGKFPESYESYFSIFDFLANHIASVEPTIRSSGNDVLPNVYCGILTLILVPLYLFTKSISLKEKIAHVSLLGFLFLSFNTNYLDYIWHGFHFPNDLPYRFSFMYSFVLLLLAYKALVRLKELTSRTVLASGIAVLFGIVLIQEIGSKNVNDTSVLISLIFVVIYCVVFAIMKNKKYQASAAAVLLLCCVLAEAAVANTDHYNVDQPKSYYANDLTDFQALKKRLDKRENGEFYRMELSNLRARMDPSWYDYNGVSVFSSMAYEKLSNLEEYLGMFGNFINSYTYNKQTPVYNAMHSLKYVVDNSGGVLPPMNSELYSPVYSEGKFHAYENKYHLPVAYCVNSEVMNWYYQSQNPFEVQNEYFSSATGIAEVFEKVEICDTLYNNVDEMYTGFESGVFTFFKTYTEQSASITFVVESETDQNLYLFVSSDSMDTLVVTADDYVTRQDTDRKYILDLGRRSAGEEMSIELPIKENSDSGYFDCYIYALNFEKFEEGYEILKSGSLNVKKHTDTEIEGSFFAEENCILYTSIPYDKGWQITIDGKAVDAKNIVAVGDSLLGIKVEAGGHEIAMKYVPVGLYKGLVISGAALIILLLAVAGSRKKARRENAGNVYCDCGLCDKMIEKQ